MNYRLAEAGLQERLAQLAPLSRAQSGRIAALCVAVILAGEVNLSRIARFIKAESWQDSRVRWIQRLLAAPFLSPERAYQPLLAYALERFRAKCWHLVIDRTTLWEGEVDLATVSLNYQRRAIPLVWCQVPFGGAAETVYIQLLQRCRPLIPAAIQVVVHGDSEFGGGGMIRALREWHWDFILGEPSRVHFRRPGEPTSQALRTLPVSHHRGYHLAHVELFARQRLAGLNLLAFYQPHHTQTGQRQRQVAYLVTSLPLHRGLRRLGRRRWATEAFYRDYKSSGWQITRSALPTPQRQAGLLTILAITYLWCVCHGRWLSKTSQRFQVDAKPVRHFSLFRLGCDSLIHQLRCNLPIQSTLRLYT